MRYTSKTGEIKERFFGFIDMHQFDAKTITSAILQIITNSGLQLSNCVAQAYDGASVMSGAKNGVNVRVEEAVGGECPYVHCYAHRLNLVLVDCCSKIKPVRELLGLLQAMYNFQSNSSLRSEYFQNSQIELGYETILKMPQSCNTRWYSKKKGLSYARNRYDAIVLALDNITEIGKADEAAEARGYLSQLKNFKGLVILVALDNILEITNSLSEYLQSSKLVITQALAICKATIKSLKEIRNNEYFEELWKDASEIAETVLVTVPDIASITLAPCKRKITQNRKFRDSIVFETTGNRSTESKTLGEELRSAVYEIIDNFISEMEKRLLKNVDLYKGLLAADPGSPNFLNEKDILEFSKKYYRLKIDQDALSGQIKIAKNLFKGQKLEKIDECLKYLASLASGFPDLYKYFQIVLTTPVANTTGERSFSTLNRLKTYLRTTMSEERLSNLAMISINRDLSNRLRENTDLAINVFGKNNNRRLNFSM